MVGLASFRTRRAASPVSDRASVARAWTKALRGARYNSSMLDSIFDSSFESGFESGFDSGVATAEGSRDRWPWRRRTYGCDTVIVKVSGAVNAPMSNRNTQ